MNALRLEIRRHDFDPEHFMRYQSMKVRSGMIIAKRCDSGVLVVDDAQSLRQNLSYPALIRTVDIIVLMGISVNTEAICYR